MSFEPLTTPWTSQSLASREDLAKTTSHRWLHDLPELRRAETELRAAVLRHAGLPQFTDADDDPRNWSRVLLAQVTPQQYRRQLVDLVQLVATPRYRIRGSDGPFNRSAVLVRQEDRASGLEDLRDRRGAISADDMNSATVFAPSAASASINGRFFASVTRYRTWPLALDGLLESDVDAAVIDGVTLALLTCYRPAMMARLRVLLWTTRSPGAPLVTARDTPQDVVDALRGGLRAAEIDPSLAAARKTLLIEGFNFLRPPHYRATQHLEQITESLGYTELR